MPTVKYLGYADHLTIPGVENTVRPGDTVTVDQAVLDDLILRRHTFEGVDPTITTLPAPHEVPDVEPEGETEFSRAGALRRLQTERGPILARVDADPPPIAALGVGTSVVPTGETPEEAELRASGKATKPAKS